MRSNFARSTLLLNFVAHSNPAKFKKRDAENAETLQKRNLRARKVSAHPSSFGRAKSVTDLHPDPAIFVGKTVAHALSIATKGLKNQI